MTNVQVKIKLDKGAKAPKREYPTDAGADLYANETVLLKHGHWANIHTGVHIEMPKGYFGLLQSKSGLNSKCGITCRGVIDEGYSGEIVATLQNIGRDKKIKIGDKVTQIILIPCLYADFVEVENIEEGERGENGFGHTGSK